MMKKIFGLLSVVLIIVGIIYYNHYNAIRTFDMDGYLFQSDNITKYLINGEISKEEKVEYVQVKYDDYLYQGRGNYYVGDYKKTQVNLNYPVVSKDSSTLLILSDQGKLVDKKFRKTTTYVNSLISDNKLFNENDYERADDSTYLFVELDDSIFVNLNELKFYNEHKEYKIPVNSFIYFYEGYLRYFSLKDGQYVYREIKGLDKSVNVDVLDKKYSYPDFVERLGLFTAEEEVEDFELPPLIEQEEEEVPEEKEKKPAEEKTEAPEEVTYVKPTVQFDTQRANVYSMQGKLEITDPTNQIVKFPTFEFWKGSTLVVRKTFVTSETIEVKGLYPNTDYEVIGVFHYKNEEGQEIKKEFTRFKISTKDISSLETLEVSVNSIKSTANSADFVGVGLNNKSSDEVLKGIRKVVVTIGNNNYQLGSALVSKLIRLERFDYSTAKSLLSNTKYDADFTFYDVSGNELKVSGGHYEFKTTKQAPSGMLAVKSKSISKANLKFDITNKDDIDIANMKYVLSDSTGKIIDEKTITDLNVTIDNLDANEIYSIVLYGDYDLEDGQGILKEQVIADGKFSTEPLTTLGYVKLNFEDIDATTESFTYKLSINNETNSVLRSLLTSVNITLVDINNSSFSKKITLTSDQFNSLIAGGILDLNCTGLESNHTYRFDLVSYVSLGSKTHEIKTLSNVNNVKTLKADASIDIVNKFVNENIIDYDVRIIDEDYAIQNNRVLLEVRNDLGVLIYFDELEVNGNYKHISIDKLDPKKYYSFTYKAEGYNIGHTNKTYISDYELFSERILTEEGLFGTVEIESLLKQVTSKNVFDIKNNRRWKTGGDRDASRRHTDLDENTVSLGAKNGYRTYSYYLPEYKGKTFTVSFKIKYADENNRPVYICPRGSNNCKDYQITGITKDNWLSYSRTFTINSSSPYVSFTIVEVDGENKITTAVLKDLQFEAGSSATSYTPYREKPNYIGTFITNLTDRNHEISKDEFHYYLRFYRNDELEDEQEFDFNDDYVVVDAISTNEIVPSSQYDIKLSIKKKIIDDEGNIAYRYYDLSSLNFSSDDEIRTIRSYEDLMAIHTSGFYLVAADIDYRNKTGYIDPVFNGIIDFQGHKVYRDTSTNGSTGNSSPRMFTNIGSNGIIKNIDMHYYIDGSARGEYQGIAYYNYGTIENVMITLEEGNNKPNTIFTLCARENYGTIKNFVVKAKDSLSVERGGGFLAYDNYGTIMNGYLYGEPINAAFYNNASGYKYVGAVAAYCGSNSYLANIFSLIEVNIGEDVATTTYQYEVGNIAGRSDRTIIRNVYSYANSKNRNRAKDANIYTDSVTKNINSSNTYYISNIDYDGSYSNKLSPGTLRLESFQEMLNSTGGFDVSNYVKFGYYPHVIWPDVMPNQDYIALPSDENNNLDYLSIENRVENDDETVEATMIFKNPGYDIITGLYFSDGLNARIVTGSQVNENNRSKIRVVFSNPTNYISKYSLTRVTRAYSSGVTAGDITYGDKERIVEVDMYKNIRNITEFKAIKTNSASLSFNYKLQTDLDFNGETFSIGTFTGKIDGNNHTIKNIRENNNNFINLLRGGTLKNLFIDTYVNTGTGGSSTASYGGLIGQADQSSNIDNVHLKNVSVTNRNTYVGGFIGYTNGIFITNSSITDVHVYETDKNIIRNSGRYGGLIGENNNTIIQNTYAQGVNVEIMYAQYTQGIGGLIGRHNSGYVQDCYVQGVVNSKHIETGGVAGYSSGYIERVISNVDVLSQQDSLGGIVGYSTNDNIFNTLVLGNVYSSKDAINQNRTIGNRTAMNSNYAWELQLVNGLIDRRTNGELLLTNEELKLENTYDAQIKIGNKYDLSKLENSKGQNLIPKLKYLNEDKLLPNQRDIAYYNDDFRVKDINISSSLNDATIQIFINNPAAYEVKEVSIDGLRIDQVNKNIYSEGQTMYEVHAVPERYYDSYLIDKIVYNDGTKDVEVSVASKINLTFYKDLNTFEDWQQIDSDIYENYRLTGDIDFTGKTNVKTKVSFNRLEATDGGHTIKNINYTHTATSGQVGLIDTIYSNISGVTFENITIDSNSSTSFTGVIRFLNGTMYNVNFNNVKVLAPRASYNGMIAFNQSPDIKNIELNNIEVKGVSYTGGFIGIMRYFDITHVTANHVTVTATGNYVGGVVGYRDHSSYSTIFNVTATDVHVTGQDEVGGVFGRAAGDYIIASDVHVSGRNYIGGICGRHYVTYTNYYSLRDAEVTGSGNYIGGAFGYSYRTYYTYLDNVTVKGTRDGGDNYVGGISGIGGYGVYYSGIKNSTITNAGNYTGGVRGKLEYATVGYTYVYNTKITGVNYVGGITGHHSSTSNTIYYNISNAEVTATGNYASGLIGRVSNLNTTSATNKIYIYRNILAGSKIRSNGNIAGAIMANSEKNPFPAHFYDNFVVADVNSFGGNISQFFVGNDDANSTYTSLLCYSTTNASGEVVYNINRGIRAYEGSTYNGVAISTHTFPEAVKQYSNSQLKVQATFKELLADTYNFTQITSGKYPYLTYQWDGSGLQLFDLPAAPAGPNGAPANGRQMMSMRPTVTSFPDVKVYVSDVDKINVEFSRIEPEMTFTINNQTRPIDQLSYTYYYDFNEDFMIVLNDGVNTKQITILAKDLREYSSVIGNNYYFLNGNKVTGNDDVSLENMSYQEKNESINPTKLGYNNTNYRVQLLANNNTIPVNIYNDKILLSNKNIYDINSKKVIANSFENLTPVDSVPLYHFDYGNNTIDTYYNYSVINGEYVSKQVFVADDSLEVIDSTLNNVKNSVLIDQDKGREYVIYLGTDGSLHSLKEDIKFPKNFKNSSIKSIRTDLYNDSDIVFVLYNNSDYVIFNYKNGNVIEQSMRNSTDLAQYFVSSFGNKSVRNNKKKDYQESLNLVQKIENKDIDTVLGRETTDQSIVEGSYKTVYNPTTKKYEIYKIPSINDDFSNKANLDEVLSSKSISNVIDNDMALYGYYIGTEKRNRTILFGVITIISSIILGIVVAIFLLKRNILNTNKEKAI